MIGGLGRGDWRIGKGWEDWEGVRQNVLSIFELRLKMKSVYYML